MSLRFAFSLGNEILANIAAERHYVRASDGCLWDFRNRWCNGGTNEGSPSRTPRGEELVASRSRGRAGSFSAECKQRHRNAKQRSQPEVGDPVGTLFEMTVEQIFIDDGSR
jgi:hypothetical protein